MFPACSVQRIDSGRRIIVAVIWTQLMLACAVILLAISFGRFDRAGRRFLVLLGEIGLMRSLWNGSRWAQGLYVLGFELGSVAMFAFWQKQPRMLPLPVVASIAGAFAVAGLMLACSRNVNAFLAFQRSGAIPAAGLEADADQAAQPVAVPALPPERVCGSCRQPVPRDIDWCPHCGATYETADV